MQYKNKQNPVEMSAHCQPKFMCSSNWNLELNCFGLIKTKNRGEKQQNYHIRMCFGARCMFWWKSSHDPAISVNEQWFVTHSITLFRKTNAKKEHTIPQQQPKKKRIQRNWIEPKKKTIHCDDEKEIRAEKWSSSWIACIFIVPSISPYCCRKRNVND